MTRNANVVTLLLFLLARRLAYSVEHSRVLAIYLVLRTLCFPKGQANSLPSRVWCKLFSTLRALQGGIRNIMRYAETVYVLTARSTSIRKTMRPPHHQFLAFVTKELNHCRSSAALEETPHLQPSFPYVKSSVSSHVEQSCFTKLDHHIFTPGEWQWARFIEHPLN